MHCGVIYWTDIDQHRALIWHVLLTQAGALTSMSSCFIKMFQHVSCNPVDLTIPMQTQDILSDCLVGLTSAFIHVQPLSLYYSSICIMAKLLG